METFNFNRNWYFKFGRNVGDEEVNKTDYSLIGLPHSFGIPYFASREFYVGYGCYYKKFNIDVTPQEKVFVEFGAVFQVAEVYVNGRFCSKHEGGFTSFVCDITKLIVSGENEIFVRVNNNWSPVIAPRATDNIFNGGIYRDVNLIVAQNSYIDINGVKITTKKLSSQSYDISVVTNVVGAISKQLISTIIDASGEVVDYKCTNIEESVVKQNFEINMPHLWTLEKPYLYTLKSQIVLVDSGVVVDSQENNFGVRTIEWSKEDGFFLNDRHILLEGANLSQDRGGWADAATHSAIKRDVKLMKDCGFNFIRGEKFPHSRQLSKECDIQGVLYWSECSFSGKAGFKNDGFWDACSYPTKKSEVEQFEKNVKQQLYEMINENYNSPSIICWSLGNEMFYTRSEFTEDVKDFVVRLRDYVHQLDPTRPVAIGGAQRDGLDVLVDVAGYSGDGAVLYKNPLVANLVSSYGGMPGIRPGRVDLYETKGSDNYYTWRAGRVISSGFHHGSYAGIGNIGICDLYRLPLNAYYAYQNKNLAKPIPKHAVRDKVKRLELKADKTYLRGDGTDDVMITCEIKGLNGERVCYDDGIELEVISGPLILPTGKKMVFSNKNRNCYDGLFAIEARGYYAGKSLVIARMDNVVSNMLVIEVLADEEYKEGKDIIFIEPPNKVTRQMSLYADLVEKTPVIVSSENVIASMVCLTKQSKTYWEPNKRDIQPYIILDFEHIYDRYMMIVSTKMFSKLKMKISTSVNNRDWEDVGITDKKKIIISNTARYIKIMVNKKAKIKRIRIFEREN